MSGFVIRELRHVGFADDDGASVPQSAYDKGVLLDGHTEERKGASGGGHAQGLVCGDIVLDEYRNTM
jgi:hypothetical protein